MSRDTLNIRHGQSRKTKKVLQLTGGVRAKTYIPIIQYFFTNKKAIIDAYTAYHIHQEKHLW